MHNRDCFWKPFRSERIYECQKLLQSWEKYFSPTFSAFWAKLRFKNLFLIGLEIFWLFVDKLTANCEYSRTNRENLPLVIQIKLSKKPYSFLLYFLTFFGIYIKFSMIWNKHQPHRSNISEMIDSERCAYFNT